MAWPAHYGLDGAERLDTVRRLGVRAIPSLTRPSSGWGSETTWMRAVLWDNGARLMTLT